MKLKLRPIKDGKDKNRYCGPSVISALTSLTTGEAARLIRLQSNGRVTRVMGTHSGQVVRALKACNIQTKYFHKPGLQYHTYRRSGSTLAAWLKATKEDRTEGRVFLIVAGNHWQLVSGRRYTCGRIRDIVSIRDKRVKRRARVSDVWELVSDNVTKPDLDVSKPKDPNAAARSKAYRLAKKIGAELDTQYIRTYGDVWVYPPSSIKDEDDPYGEHNVYEWSEAVEMLETYQSMLSK